MPTTTAVRAPIFENIPERLTERPQWVCWRLEERDGKMTKVPYAPYPEGPAKASTRDLMTWDTFRMAVGYYEEVTKVSPHVAPFDGIGFVFCSGDPFCGIDLDDCRDPESGEISSWAQEIIDSVQEGYVEISPSGTGIHIIVEGTVRGGGMRKGKVEMYSQGRFFTITGRVL